MTDEEKYLLLGAMQAVRYLFACRLHDIECAQHTETGRHKLVCLRNKHDEARVRGDQVQALVKYLMKTGQDVPELTKRHGIDSF